MRQKVPFVQQIRQKQADKRSASAVSFFSSSVSLKRVVGALLLSFIALVGTIFALVNQLHNQLQQERHAESRAVGSASTAIASPTVTPVDALVEPAATASSASVPAPASVSPSSSSPEPPAIDPVQSLDQLLAGPQLRALESSLEAERKSLAQWLVDNKLAVIKHLNYLLDRGEYRLLYQRARYFHGTYDPDVARFENFAARRVAEMDRRQAEADRQRQMHATRLATLKRKLGEEQAEANYQAQLLKQEGLAEQARKARDAKIKENAAALLMPLVKRECGPSGEVYRGYQWYQDARSPSCKRGKGLFFYIGYAPGRPVVLMMRVQEGASLPVRDFHVRVGEQQYSFSPVTFEKMFPDLIGSPVAYETPAHAQAVTMALAVLDAKKAYLNLRQDQWDPSLRPWYTERLISSDDREAMDQVLSIYARLEAY